MNKTALVLVLCGFVAGQPHHVAFAFKASEAQPVQAAGFMARFSGAPASDAVRQHANHVLSARDHHQRPFVIIDKSAARVFVMGADGVLLAHAPVLLGAALGDDSVPGIGERPIAEIQPFERTTPAGRFVAEAGRNINGEDIVWVDYGAAVSMHRVRAANPRDRRLERLASETAADNRISYGCINVPVEFYNQVISPLFSKGPHVVYVLPEAKTARAVSG